jgi:hypothetical protein
MRRFDISFGTGQGRWIFGPFCGGMYFELQAWKIRSQLRQSPRCWTGRVAVQCH